MVQRAGLIARRKPKLSFKKTTEIARDRGVHVKHVPTSSSRLPKVACIQYTCAVHLFERASVLGLSLHKNTTSQTDARLLFPFARFLCFGFI